MRAQAHARARSTVARSAAVTGIVTLTAALVAILLMAPVLWAEPAPPRLEVRGGAARLLELPEILDDEEVARQLSTGLTTTFVFRASGRTASGAALEGAARIEIRFEPWDEVYFLLALGRDGELIRDTLASHKALAERWRALDLALTPAGRTAAAGRWQIELDVIPFSRGEQRDTQRWFSESMDRDAGAEQAARASEDRSEALEEVFNLLLATSIGRRAILSYGWTVKAPSVRVPSLKAPR